MLKSSLSQWRLPAILCVAWASCAAAAGTAPSVIDPLADAEIVDVARELRVNGTPTRIREFRLARPLAQVLTQCRTWLGPQRVEVALDGWKVLARKDGQQFTMLRLRAQGLTSTVGTLSESSPQAVLEPRAFRDFALPADTRLGSEIITTDAGARSRLLTFTNLHPVSVNVEHFRASLQARGYRLERELVAAPGTSGGRSLWLTGEDGDALLVIAEFVPQPSTGQARTAITLNLVTRPRERAR